MRRPLGYTGVKRKGVFIIKPLRKDHKARSGPGKHSVRTCEKNPFSFLPCRSPSKPVTLFSLLTRKGFSLIEILVVIAILGALSSIAVPGYSRYIDKVRIKKAVIEIRMVEKDILSFQSDNSRWPDSLVDIGRGNLLDPWGNPYRYYNVDANGVGKSRKDRGAAPINDDYDLYSMGKDGVSKLGLQLAESQDDIVRADEGRFVGLGSEF